MMKEIKFKVWDKENKKMYYPNEISVQIFDEGFYHIEHLNGKILMQPEHARLLQFTGLTDKNGKEIYEGDIVEGNPIGATFCVTGKIIFLDGAFRVQDANNKNRLIYDDFFGKVRVIGNIYEHPEFLEK